MQNKDKPQDNFNHWKTLETTLTTESNEWNQMTYCIDGSSASSVIFFD